MRILVSDPLSEQGLAILGEHFTVDVLTKLSEEELIKKIADYDALVIRSGTQVTRKVIEAASKMKIIGRAGVGVDNVDVEAATEKGIIVTNAPEGNMLSAAEHTVAMMMGLARNIPQANASLKSKKWERNKFMGVEVNGKTLGVIGLGRIGQAVARRARGFDMDILYTDSSRHTGLEQELGVSRVPLEQLLENADIISLHVPLTETTRGMIGAEQLQRM